MLENNGIVVDEALGSAFNIPCSKTFLPRRFFLTDNVLATCTSQPPRQTRKPHVACKGGGISQIADTHLLWIVVGFSGSCRCEGRNAGAR